ncbi:MAG: carboxypeptidase regulatory-like domain-containing protein [Planctomycetes bacterium]|nr:carboxypeptidase regulatory-like domain-containing protein [Planctomycetota bacterium]
MDVVRLAVVLALVATTRAQDAPSVTGRVVDAARKGVAGATVELLHRPIPNCLELGSEQRIVVAANGSGVFRARVTADRRYTVRAWWEGGASRVEDGVEAGAFVTLARDPFAVSQRVALAGLEPWAERGPLALQALVGGETIDFAAVPMADGVATIPPLPGFEHRPLELLGADGEVIWSAAPEASEGHAVDGSLAWSVPPPFELDLVVRDAATKAPIAGAVVRRHIRNHWITRSPLLAFGERFRAVWPAIGRSDAAGRLHARIPLLGRGDPTPDTLWLLALADGHRASHCGWNDGKPFRESHLLAGDGGPLEFRLTADAVQRRRIVLPEGNPAAPGRALLGWRVWVRGDGSGSGTPFFSTASIADGAVVFAPPPEFSVLESLALESPARLRIEPADGDGTSDIDLRAGGSASRSIEVVRPDGRPAERVVVLVTNADAKSARGEPAAARCDRLGRVTVSLACASRVVAYDGSAWGIAVVDPAASTTTRIAMQELPCARVRVVDQDGQPLAGVVVRTSGFRVALGGEGAALTPGEAAQIGRWSVVVETDAEGIASIPQAPIDGTLRLELRDPRRALLDCGSGELECPVAPSRETVLRFTAPRG